MSDRSENGGKGDTNATTDSPAATTADETKTYEYWLDNPKNVRRVINIFLVCCVALFLLDAIFFAFEKHLSFGGHGHGDHGTHDDGHDGHESPPADNHAGDHGYDGHDGHDVADNHAADHADGHTDAGHHPDAPANPFPYEGWFGFYPFYGFVACVLLVLVAKQMRKVLQRPEDYYS